MPTTMSPRASSASTTCDPMNPAAPVTTTFSATRLHPVRGEAREIVDGLLQPLADPHLRLPAEHRARARDVGLADLGIVLGERALDEGRGGIRQLAHHLGELAHRVLDRVADVAGIVIALHEELIDPLDLVRHVAE